MNTNYPKSIITMHWLTFLLVIIVYMSSGNPIGAGWIGDLHVGGGILILVLFFIRIILIFFHQKDIPQHGVTNIYQNILFKIVKFTLYLSLFIVPVFGWLALSSLTENFQIQSLNISLLSSVKNNYFIADIHKLLGNIFITLVGLHACAALIYHFIFKDNVLKSMFLKKK